MAIGTIVHFVAGAVLKIISTHMAQSMSMDREIKMAALNRDQNILIATQSGKDTADWSLRALRFLVVLPFIYAFLWMAGYCITHPDLQFHVAVGKSMSPIWSWLIPFPVTKDGYVLITAGTIIWNMWNGVWLILGFVVTKFGK